MIFKDAVLTTEFSVLWNDMEIDHENLEQVLMPCLSTLHAALTLRLLMSYIYIYMEHPFLMFLDHTRRRSTVGRTPLDE